MITVGQLETIIASSSSAFFSLMVGISDELLYLGVAVTVLFLVYRWFITITGRR